LDRVSQAVFPTAGGPGFLHPAATELAGGDLRNAYTSAGATPPSGTNRNGPLTIATVQFSNWSASDLALYADHNALSLRAGQYTAVPVDGGTKNLDGESEVDLDQESILATAPTANQRAYIAPNTAAATVDAYTQVLDDVRQDQYAVDGGDPHIAALSSSWGLCESYTGTKEINALEPVLSSLAAAGVTVFNSSGDDGIYDCGATTGQRGDVPSATPTVDYPGSSPHVVAVGGDTVSPIGTSAPNTGSNWTETGWSCTSAKSCESESGGGTGGGVSAGEAEPAYQSNNIANPLYTAVGKRLVPDISGDGNPATGFRIYSNDATVDGPCEGARQCVYGGTSLATPTSAALFTNLLSSYGRTAGIGDIHAGLYTAFADTKSAAPAQRAFRDVTSGTNGATADKGQDPSVSAATGYDTLSGLGGVLWPAAASYLLSLTAAPTAAAVIARPHPHSAAHPSTVTASWTVKEAAKGAGPASASVRVTRAGSAQPVYSSVSAAPTGSTTFTGTPGDTYVLTVTGKDLAGNTSSTVTKTLSVPLDDKHFHLHGTWHRVKNGNDLAGSRATATSRHSHATAGGTGREFLLLVQTGPSQGKVAVYRGSQKLTTINLYSAKVHHIAVRIFGSAGSAVAKHSFTIRPTGTRSAASSGHTADVDGLSVIR
jgi:kumamolisin